MSYFSLIAVPSTISADAIDIQYTDNGVEPIISKSLNSYSNSIKLQIDTVSDVWDIYKKITNPYEYIHTPIPNSKQAICKLKPLSRAFYKLVEICKLLSILNHYTTQNMNSFHLAEGPGGFIEALAMLRNNPKDNYYAMTLIEEDQNIPGWKKSVFFLSKNPNVTIENGYDGTGDLMVWYNLVYCHKKYRGTIDLITADGGFDFSIDFNKQESLSIKLILSQIAFAISMQKIGGVFILKIFDVFTQPTIDLLYLLSGMYETVHIVKPYTSRYANSERYVVCKGFRLQDVATYLKQFESIYRDSRPITRVLKTDIPYIYINKLEECNAILGQQQIENISNTLNLIENNNTDKIESMRKNNIQKCINWCQKHKVPFNKNIHQTNIFLTPKSMG